MISIDEARAAVLEQASPLAPEDVAVELSLGRVLAAEVIAEHDVPRFANSAMDGFALRSSDGEGARRIVGESRAGAPSTRPLGAGEAIRISTGAALPAGADPPRA